MIIKRSHEIPENLQSMWEEYPVNSRNKDGGSTTRHAVHDRSSASG